MNSEEGPKASSDQELDIWAGPDAISHIRKTLSAASSKPRDALRQIRQAASLRDAGCAPLLAMLELQGVPAITAHKRLLDEACPSRSMPYTVPTAATCPYLSSHECTSAPACPPTLAIHASR